MCIVPPEEQMLTLYNLCHFLFQPEFAVNGVNITYFDIPTTNGYIHVLQQPFSVMNRADKQGDSVRPRATFYLFK